MRLEACGESSVVVVVMVVMVVVCRLPSPSLGPWCLGQGGLGGVSDVAHIEVSGGAYRAGFPPAGSPGDIHCPPDGEEGFHAGIVGCGSSHIVVCCHQKIIT